jgi:hypothetical protein
MMCRTRPPGLALTLPANHALKLQNIRMRVFQREMLEGEADTLLKLDSLTSCICLSLHTYVTDQRIKPQLVDTARP